MSKNADALVSTSRVAENGGGVGENKCSVVGISQVVESRAVGNRRDVGERKRSVAGTGQVIENGRGVGGHRCSIKKREL